MAKRYVVVFDLETKNLIEQADWRRREDKVKALDISVVCVLKLDSDLILHGSESSVSEAMKKAEMVSFWPHVSGENGFSQLFDIFDAAETIGTYNGLAFDNLVLQKHYKNHGGFERYLSHVFKNIDLFQRLRDTHGKWFKLDAVLEANGLDTKPASGLDAVRWWQQGRLDLIEEYCKADVLQLAKLFLLNELIVPATNGVKAPPALFALAPAIAAARHCNKRDVAKNPDKSSSQPSEPSKNRDYQLPHAKRSRNSLDVVGCVDDVGSHADQVPPIF